MSAPRLSSSLATEGRKRKRKRSKRGGKRKRKRAGTRKNQLKSDRLAKTGLRVLYWNCTSLKVREATAEKLTYGADIVCLQETKLGEKKAVHIEGFSAVYNRSGHGQVILIRDTIKFCELDVSRWSSPNLHLLAVQLLEQPVSNVINVYACNRAVNEEEWGKLGDIESSLPGSSVVCGDFNARGAEWGNVITNPQGTALEDALVQTNLSYLNDGRMTRLGQREGDSDGAIDLALASVQVATDCTWNVLPYHGSDHLPCTVHVRRRHVARRPRQKRAFEYDTSGSDPVSKLRKRAIPAKKPSQPDITQPPWWNPEVDKLWKAKREALKRSQRNRNPEDLEPKRAEKEAVKAFKVAVSEAKDAVYEGFCQEVSEDRALFKFWNLYRSMARKTKPCTICDFQSEDGTWAKTDQEKGEALFNRYLQQTDQQNEDERRNLLSAIRRQFEDEIFSFSLEESTVEKNISHSANTAPGPDGVRFSHMKELDDDGVSQLTALLNDSLYNGTIPNDWLDSHLAALPKPEKDHTKIAAYRIITMQNCIGKLCEKSVGRRVAQDLEDNESLPSTLGSYRRGKETWMNAAVLASDIYDGFERGEETLVVALDLEDAYNRVRYDVLLRTMVRMGVRPQLIIWIGEALLKRSVALRVGTWTSERRTITPGLPQGSALSPVLFNIYTVGITSNQLEGPGRTLSFADDVTPYRQGKIRTEIAESMQLELDRIGLWCTDHNGSLQPSKAGALWCSLNNHAVKAVMPTVSISEQELERVHDLRHLGITFDRSLSGKDHISRIVTKARKGLNALKLMAIRRMPQRILFILYETLVLSVIDYGFGVLTLSASQLRRLDVVQNEAMRTILGCTRDTSAEAMRYLLDLPCMEERHKIAQVKAYLRVSSDPQNPLHHKVGREVVSRLKRGTEWMNQAANTISLCINIDDIRRGREWVHVDDPQKRFTTVVAELGRECREWREGRTNAAIEALIDDNRRDGDVVIFTDGSVKRGTKSGWAFSARDGDSLIRVMERSGATEVTTSSMYMEVVAITETFKWLTSTEYESATIVTDSMSTLAKIRNSMLHAEWKEAIRSSNLARVVWIFCPGHAGVDGNERADELAGMAVVGETVALDPPTVLASLTEWFNTNRVTAPSHTLDVVIEKGCERGDGRRCDLRGAARRIHNQLLTETISLHTLRKTLETRSSQLWTCAACNDDCATDK